MAIARVATPQAAIDRTLPLGAGAGMVDNLVYAVERLGRVPGYVSSKTACRSRSQSPWLTAAIAEVPPHRSQGDPGVAGPRRRGLDLLTGRLAGTPRVLSSFVPQWAGVADAWQAARMVQHLNARNRPRGELGSPRRPVIPTPATPRGEPRGGSCAPPSASGASAPPSSTAQPLAGLGVDRGVDDDAGLWHVGHGQAGGAQPQQPRPRVQEVLGA